MPREQSSQDHDAAFHTEHARRHAGCKDKASQSFEGEDLHSCVAVQIGVTQQFAFDLKCRLLGCEVEKGRSFRGTFQLGLRFGEAAMALARTGGADEKRCVHDAQGSGLAWFQKAKTSNLDGDSRL